MMKRLFITMFITMLISCYNSIAQTIQPTEQWIEYVEEVASESDNEQLAETLYSELSYLSEHPIDINRATKEQLIKLPFLSDKQIESLLAYPNRYGKMISLYELKNITYIDFKTLSLLLPFVYIDDTAEAKRSFSPANLVKYGKNEVIIRYDQCLQRKQGYRSYPDSVLSAYPNRKYVGEPFYNSLRYSYTFDDRLQVGFIAEKDAGEPFWTKRHKGYDFYAAHIFLKDLGWLKSLAIGDYKMSFGQGLVVSNDFFMTSNASVTLMERRRNGFRRHQSTNETDFFRGAAGTVSFKNIDVSLFYSLRRMDAKIDSGQFTSIKTDGLHRVESDFEKQRTIRMTAYGGNIRYATPLLSVGITALSYSFGKNTFIPEPKPYNIYYFKGKRNYNISTDYRFSYNTIKFYGETAFSRNGALATLNALSVSPASYLSFLLLYRYYDKHFHSYFGNSYAQNSNVQNEQGIYMGMEITPFAHWKVGLSADLFRFPWLRYGTDSPSEGKELRAQIDYAPSKTYSAYIRYRYKEKEYDSHKIRIQMTYNLSETLYGKTSVGASLYNKNKWSNGFMIAQNVGWKPKSIPLQLDAYMGYFNTEDYNSRQYSYEKNLLYAFGGLSFYGKGIRLSGSFSWKITTNLTLSAKLGHTHYNNRDNIGTGTEEINGSNKTDLNTSIRWKF